MILRAALGILICLCSIAQAQSKAPGLVGGFIVGSAQFVPLSPNSNQIKINNGTYFSLVGQKRFGLLQLYLVGSLDYLKSNGNLNYNYTSPSNLDYTASMVNYNLDSFRLSMGLRFKIIENSFFRPYIEGGGSGAYSQFTYDSTLRTPAVISLGSDYKTSDSALDFGVYGQAGVEADLSHEIGAEIAVRYAHQNTEPIITFKNQILIYDCLTYMIGAYLRF